MILRKLLIIASVAMLAISSFGCEAVRDAVANVSGAPTSAEFDRLKEQIEIAEAKEAEATRAIDVLVEQERAENERAAQIAAQREALEAQYAAMAGQLVGLAGEARAAMVEMMDSLRRRIDHVGDLQRQQAELVSRYQREIAQSFAQLAYYSEEIDKSETEFESKLAQREQAFAGLTGAIDSIAGVAVTLGAPEAAVESGKGVIGALLGVTLAGAPTGAFAWYRDRAARRRKKIIQTTERYDLLDRADPDRKAQAKAQLTAAEAAELAKITAPVSKLAHATRAGDA